MPGPMPNPNRRRRNQPTIPTTALPAGGRSGPAPRVPAPVKLEAAGKSWWRWAWSTPQAAAWDAGAVQIVARRATLEDDLVAGEAVDGLDLSGLNEEIARGLEKVVRRLASLATGRVAILREMREHDRTLGLTPKAMAELRWAVTADEVAEARESKTPARRLRAVDPSAVARPG